MERVDLTAVIEDVAMHASGALWWPFVLVVLVAIARLPVVKGWFGEVFIKVAASVALPDRTYRRFHNVFLPSENGTTQIDHVFVSPYGIFSVETKNIKGWIVGAAHQRQWTQKLFRRSSQFQNPIRQNYKHTQALQEILEVPAHTIHSVVVFVGDCKIKTKMPENVVRGWRYIRYIKAFRERVFMEGEVESLAGHLEAGRLEGSSTVCRQHIEEVQRRKSTPRKLRRAECGADMVLRQARRGTSKGSRFWGCSRFPECRSTKTADNG